MEESVNLSFFLLRSGVSLFVSEKFGGFRLFYVLACFFVPLEAWMSSEAAVCVWQDSSVFGAGEWLPGAASHHTFPTTHTVMCVCVCWLWVLKQTDWGFSLSYFPS